MSESSPSRWAWRLRSEPSNGAKAIRYTALTGSMSPPIRTTCRNPMAGLPIEPDHRAQHRPSHHEDFEEGSSPPPAPPRTDIRRLAMGME